MSRRSIRHYTFTWSVALLMSGCGGRTDDTGGLTVSKGGAGYGGNGVSSFGGNILPKAQGGWGYGGMVTPAKGGATLMPSGGWPTYGGTSWAGGTTAKGGTATGGKALGGFGGKATGGNIFALGGYIGISGFSFRGGTAGTGGKAGTTGTSGVAGRATGGITVTAGRGGTAGAPPGGSSGFSGGTGGTTGTTGIAGMAAAAGTCNWPSGCATPCPAGLWLGLDGCYTCACQPPPASLIYDNVTCPASSLTVAVTASQESGSVANWLFAFTWTCNVTGAALGQPLSASVNVAVPNQATSPIDASSRMITYISGAALPLIELRQPEIIVAGSGVSTQITIALSPTTGAFFSIRREGDLFVGGLQMAATPASGVGNALLTGSFSAAVPQ